MDAGSSKLANGDSAGYWQAASEGRLEFQRCADCGHVQFPPRVQCATCWSDAIEPLTASGRGTIESITIVRRAPLKELRDQVPYAVVAVTTEEGPRMVTNLLGDAALDAAIGDCVEACFAPNADGEILPQFRLAQA